MSGVDFVAEAIVRRASTSIVANVDSVEQGRRGARPHSTSLRGATSTDDVAVQAAHGRRRPLHSRMYPADLTVGSPDHSTHPPRALVAADLVSSVNFLVDDAFVAHRSRRGRLGRVFRRPLRADPQENHLQGEHRPEFASRVASPCMSLSRSRVRSTLTAPCEESLHCGSGLRSRARGCMGDRSVGATSAPSGRRRRGKGKGGKGNGSGTGEGGGKGGGGGGGGGGGSGDGGGGGGGGMGGGGGGTGARGAGGTGAVCPGAGAFGAAGARGTGAVGTGARGAGGTGARGAGGAGGTRAGGSGTVGTTQWRPFFLLHPQTSLPPPGLHVSLPSPPESSLLDVPDPESDLARDASPNITRFLATLVTDPSFESTAASALVTELVDFAATCHLDYVATLVTESESDCPPSVGGELALGTDVLEDR
ncbi:unnamed protein product [Closterium sp. NIES-54]